MKDSNQYEIVMDGIRSTVDYDDLEDIVSNMCFDDLSPLLELNGGDYIISNVKECNVLDLLDRIKRPSFNTEYLNPPVPNGKYPNLFFPNQGFPNLYSNIYTETYNSPILTFDIKNRKDQRLYSIMIYGKSDILTKFLNSSESGRYETLSLGNSGNPDRPFVRDGNYIDAITMKVIMVCSGNKKVIIVTYNGIIKLLIPLSLERVSELNNFICHNTKTTSENVIII